MGVAAGFVCFMLGLCVAAAVIGGIVFLTRSGEDGDADAPEPEAPQFEIRVSYGGDDRWDGHKKLDARAEQLWVPPGHEARVGDLRLPGGMLYIGHSLAAVAQEWTIEAALVDPRLPAGGTPDHLGERMGYWPSYSSIDPDCRAAYLRWLAGGRSDPNTAIGYVFLFFYGLERRLLGDAEVAAIEPEERAAILTEVRRLRSIYTDSGSVNSYSRGFLDFLEMTHETERLYLAEPPKPEGTRRLSHELRVGLGQLARDGRPLPWTWAWAWVNQHPETRRRTPASRCEEEMERLFATRYERDCGDGIVLKPGRKRLVQQYRPASPSLRRTFAREVGGLPDIEAQPGPIRRLQAVFEECMADLDPFSRWLGRNPAGRGTLQAAALLPAELVDGSEGSGTADLAAWLEQVLDGDAPAITSPEPLLTRWGAAEGRSFRKADAVGLAQVLGKLGVGMEPDVRFGGPRPDKVKRIVLFRSAPGAPTAPSPAYTVAVLSTFFGAAAATADDVVAPEERDLLTAQIQEADGMTEGDRARLVAHLEWLLVERPGLAGLKKRLEAVDSQRRSAIGHLLIRVVAADGRIEREELKVLAKLYRQLGLDPASVHSDVHTFLAGGTPAAGQPVTVRDPVDAPGFAIPEPGTGQEEPSRSARPPVAIDRTVLQSKLSESREAGRLLASIFEDEEDAEDVASPKPETDEVDLVEGLDLVHSRFLRGLAEKELWARADVEDLAGRLDLLVDGAIETINDLAFDAVDEPALDGDDPIELNPVALEAMLC